MIIPQHQDILLFQDQQISNCKSPFHIILVLFINHHKLVQRETETYQQQAQIKHTKYAQIEPSINQFNVTRLSILIQTVPAGGFVGVGVCDRDQMNYKKHIANIQLGWSAYMVFQNGLVQHSDNSTYNNQIDSFTFSSNSLPHYIQPKYQGASLL